MFPNSFFYIIILFYITKTFKLLGNLVGVIALIVGAITIFIVIFVNAITRRKYIGILKGIGISAHAIEISYVIQSLFYALSGVLVASLFLLGFLKISVAQQTFSFPLSSFQDQIQLRHKIH